MFWFIGFVLLAIFVLYGIYYYTHISRDYNKVLKKKSRICYLCKFRKSYGEFIKCKFTNDYIDIYHKKGCDEYQPRTPFIQWVVNKIKEWRK